MPTKPRAEITNSTTSAAEPSEPLDPSIVPLTVEQERAFGKSNIATGAKQP